MNQNKHGLEIIKKYLSSNYQDFSVIGKGAFGIVFKATSKPQNQLVAIKVKKHDI